MKDNDGVYIEVFVVKDGTRINLKTIDMKEVGITLTNSLMDGLEKIVAE
jgi:hypothetical protein